MKNGRTTPDNMTDLEPNEVFVFGSNAAGKHIGGAALAAVERFGAVMGIGEGLGGGYLQLHQLT